jgi:hypothetical protein
VKGTRDLENTSWKFVENLKVNNPGPSLLVIGKFEGKKDLWEANKVKL